MFSVTKWALMPAWHESGIVFASYSESGKRRFGCKVRGRKTAQIYFEGKIWSRCMYRS